MQVYVVTGLDLGWDCVVGVYLANYEDLLARFPDDDYVISEHLVQTDITD